MIPKTVSGYESISRTIPRKGMQDIKKEIPAYPDSFYRPPLKPTEMPTQVIHGKIWESYIHSLE